MDRILTGIMGNNRIKIMITFRWVGTCNQLLLLVNNVMLSQSDWAISSNEKPGTAKKGDTGFTLLNRSLS